MLSSPYPVPRLAAWTVPMVLGALQGLGAGAWVLLSPPRSYEGIGLALTFAWGAMLIVGSLLILVAHLIRVHQVELPGLAFALGGILTYVYLSWEQTFGDSPGSGPRALLLGWLLCFLLTRLVLLLYVDLKARARKDRQEEAADG